MLSSFIPSKPAKTSPVYKVVIRPTLNNLFLSVTSRKGALLHWSSCGSSGNRGPRRSTPLAAEQSARGVSDWLYSKRMRHIEVRVVGPFGRRARSAVRGLFHSGRLLLRRLQLAPPVAHNGLRPKKQRRVLGFRPRTATSLHAAQPIWV